MSVAVNYFPFVFLVGSSISSCSHHFWAGHHSWEVPSGRLSGLNVLFKQPPKVPYKAQQTPLLLRKLLSSSSDQDDKPVCPRCGSPFTETFSTFSKFQPFNSEVYIEVKYFFNIIVASTRFIECSKCRHFFMFVANEDESFKGLDGNESSLLEDYQHLPSPKEVHVYMVHILFEY